MQYPTAALTFDQSFLIFEIDRVLDLQFLMAKFIVS